MRWIIFLVVVCFFIGIFLPSITASNQQEIFVIDAGPTCLLTWSPDGIYLASVECDKSIIHIWNTSTWDEVTSFGVEEARLYAIDWHPNSKIIAAASRNKIVRIWDLETGKAIYSIELSKRSEKELFEGGELPSIDWHPNGILLAMAHDFDLQLWNPSNDSLDTIQPVIEEHEFSVVGLKWSPSGNSLALADAEGRFSVLDETTLEPIFQFIPEFPAIFYGVEKAIIWEPNEKRVAMIRNFLRYYAGAVTNDVQIFDAETGTLLRELVGHEEPINSISWSYDGQWLASSSGRDQESPTEDNSIRVWNMNNYAQAYLLDSHSASVTDIVWHPEQNLLASASFDGTIRIWEIPDTR